MPSRFEQLDHSSFAILVVHLNEQTKTASRGRVNDLHRSKLATQVSNEADFCAL